MVIDERFEGCKLPSGSYSARGAMGQFLVVIPEYDMVVVHQVDSDRKNIYINIFRKNKCTSATNGLRQDNKETVVG